MSNVLRQSTAVDVTIGPFVDSTNGFTAEDGVSPAVKLSKIGQTLAAKSDVTTPVLLADGYYNCEFDATDTDTTGTLVLSVIGDSVSLPVRHEYQVLTQDAYDFIYSSGSAPDSQVANLPTTSEFNARTIDSADYFDPAADTVANVTAVASVTGAVGSVTGAVGSVTGNVAGSVASVTGAVGSVSGNVDGNVSGSVASVTGSVGSVTGAVGSVTGAVGSVMAEVSADITSISGSGPAADQLEQNVVNDLVGVASGIPTVTDMISNITVTVDDQFKGRIITFDENTPTAALRRQSTDITAATAATNTLIFTALTTAPAANDTFVIT